MSVFTLPRLHFTGVAISKLPTGPRCGLVDLATTTALRADGTPFPLDRPAREYHDELGAAKGSFFSGNGHFSIEASVSSVEFDAGEIDVTDPMVGRSVDMWGHYNPYLQTTANRARIFDVDPSSNRTTTVMVGQFGFGRAGRSHDTGYALTGTVSGFQPPRWHSFHGGGSVVHQFVVPAEDIVWLAESPFVAALRSVATDGIVVQFALTDGTPGDDSPSRFALRGTVAPWHRTESRTFPAGRLLVPCDGERALHTLTVDLTAEHVTMNMITAVREAPTHDLQLRTVDTWRLVADVPRRVYRDGGLVRVPRLPGSPDDEALVLAHGDRVLLREQEITVVVDDACQFLEHPRGDEDSEFDVEVAFRALFRGRPHALSPVTLRQSAEIVRMRPEGGEFADTCVVHTDADGIGRFTLRGVHAGAARVLLDPADSPWEFGYDDDLRSMHVRVLPDDWWLADLPAEQVTFDLVYREIFAYYELVHSFMREEVFSLADRCKVETYAKLVWQMCDPRNKAKTYYMPPTRELTEPKAWLLLTYLRAQQTPSEVVQVLPSAGRSRGIASRAELVTALRHAVTLELAVMLQYLYAAYSVPAHGAGLEYVRRGEWTAEQLRIACGDGGETIDDGIRGTLLAVAREEMIHFLMANNILMAIGEPFFVPHGDFGTINSELPVPLDFSLERLDFGSIQRFLQIEQPDSVIGEVRLGDRVQGTSGDYSSLSELYGDIRRALREVPGLFLVDRGRGGGEHHLFLRESINQRHPDYQLEVDDLSSALFAVDVITEQGEGSEDPGEDSHYEAFLGVSDILRAAGWIPSYPVLRNPSLHTGNLNSSPVTDPDARAVMRLFNDAYFVMLQLMVQHFGAGADTSLRRSRLMNGAIDLMTGVLRPLGELLVTMPSGRRGRTAGPSFELDTAPAYIARPDVAMRSVALRLDDIAAQAAKCPLVPARVAELSTLLADQLRGS